LIARSAELASFDPAGLVVRPLVDDREFVVALVCFEPGQEVTPHLHEHKDEVFDVVEGEGEVMLGTTWHPAGPGTIVYVPAGTPHALRNRGTARWVVRETARQRIYARQALRMVAAALLRRLRHQPADRVDPRAAGVPAR